MSDVSSLPWLQLALEAQDRLELQSQVNVAARRVDVLVGGGLRAALQPEDETETLALHVALQFDDDASTEQRDALVRRVDPELEHTEVAIVNERWLAMRRRHPYGEIGDEGDVADRLERFLVESLEALREADRDEIL